MMSNFADPAQLLAAVAIVQRRKRSDAILAKVRERAEFARTVAHNWADEPRIDVNATVHAEDIA